MIVFCKRVVVRVTDAAHRGVDACFSKTFRVSYGQVLHTPVAVVHEVFGVGAGIERLLQRVESQVASTTFAWSQLLAQS